MKQKQFGRNFVSPAAGGLTALVALATLGTIFAVSTRTADAQADQYERYLAGIKLNSRAGNVLKYYGNPNDVVIGDVGFRDQPAGAGGGAAGQAGAGAGQAGRSGGVGGGSQSLGGGRGSLGRGGGGPPAGFGGPPAGFGGPPAGFGGPPAGFGGPPAGFGGPPAGFGGAGRGGGEELGGGLPGGFGGAPAGLGGGGVGGAQGGGVGGFGATQSNTSPQQETTWIYNRRAGKDVISYEFLVGTGGTVSQIRAIGYAGGNIKTSKGVQLGTTYKNVVLKYGVPEEQFRVGRSLIASYRGKNHVVFQFLNQRGQQENPFSAGNKVIAITIATIE